MDENGEETLQPAEVVVLSAWTPNSVRLLLLSDIGEPYDPVTAKGTLGKNLTHQVTSGGAGMLVFKERLNLFMGSGAVGYGIADLDGDIKQEVPEKILRGGAFLRGAAAGEGPAGSFGRIPQRRSLAQLGRGLEEGCDSTLGQNRPRRRDERRPLCLSAKLHGPGSHLHRQMG